MEKKCVFFFVSWLLAVITFSDVKSQCNIGITLDPIPNVCRLEASQQFQVTYSNIWGSPNGYRVDWDNAANAAGLPDVSISGFSSFPTRIPIGSAPVPGNFNGVLYLSNSATGCESVGYPVNVMVSDLPSITLQSSDQFPWSSELIVCMAAEGVQIPYTATGSPDLYHITWGTNSGPGSSWSTLPQAGVPITNTTWGAIVLPTGMNQGRIYVKNSTTGCVNWLSQAPFTIRVMDQAILKLNQDVSVCPGTSATSVPFTFSPGVWNDPANTVYPVHYTVNWNDAAKQAGLIDSPTTTMPSNPSAIPVNPLPTVPGTYTGVFKATYPYYSGGRAYPLPGCDWSASMQVNIKPYPYFSLQSSDIFACPGATAAVIAYNATDAQQYSLNWDQAARNAGLVDQTLIGFPSDKRILINNIPATTGTYNATLTIHKYIIGTPQSCVITYPIRLTVGGKPTITPSGPVDFCVGGFVELKAPTTYGATYRWKRNGIDIGNTNPLKVTTSGTYTVTVTFASCTATSDPMAVSVSSVVAADNKSVCQGDAVTLTASPSGGSWSGTGVVGSVFSSAGLATGNYVVTYTHTDANGCTGTANATVTVNAVPVVTADAKSVCLGSSVPLTGSPAGGTWSGTGVNGSTFNSAGLQVGWYSVTYGYTNAYGCYKSATAIVTVNSLPTAAITAGGATTFCAGGSVILSANTGLALSYRWKRNGSDISGATASSYTATTTGSYTCTVTSQKHGCSKTSNAINVTVNSVTVTGFTGTAAVCKGNTYTYSVSVSGGPYTYQWTKPLNWQKYGGSETGPSVTYYVPSYNTQYGAVTVKVSIGECFAQNGITAYPGQCGGGGYYSFTVTPNPATDMLTVERIVNEDDDTGIPSDLILSEEYRVELTNGYKSMNFTGNERMLNINTSSLPRGLYILKVVHNGKVTPYKISLK